MRLRITTDGTSDGTSDGTVVADANTGEPIEGLTSVTWTTNGSQPALALIEVEALAVSVVGESLGV